MLKEIDVIGKKIEIYKVKLLLFMAVASGSWVYALKFDGISYVVILWFVFLTSIIGIFLNMTKLSNMEKKLEETR
jgi:hypothetical protein